MLAQHMRVNQGLTRDYVVPALCIHRERRERTDDVTVSSAERVGATLLALQAVGVAALVGWEVVSLATSPVASVPSSLALIVLTAVGAFALGGFAWAVWRGDSWGRSGGIVLQLLIIAVGFGTFGGSEQGVMVGVVLIALGVVTGVTLVLAVRAAARRGDGGDASATEA